MRKNTNIKIKVITLFSIIGIAAILITYQNGIAVQPVDDLSDDKSALEALLPKNYEIPGWERSSNPQFFVPENLWEYMNGQAESYLQYSFLMLATVDYILEDNPNSLILEIFKMKTPNHAFGIYAAERSTKDKFVKIGVEGYIGPNVLNFWKGSYYIKITAFESSTNIEKMLPDFGAKIAQQIEGEYSAPELLNYFPVENKIHKSERYIPQNFMGYSFFKNGYRVDYEFSGNQFQVFLMDNHSLEEAEDSFKKYKETFKPQNENISHEIDSDYQSLEIKNGKGKIFFQYKSIVGGVLNIDDLSQGKQIVNDLLKRLKTKY